jgi:hypothetical protein
MESFSRPSGVITSGAAMRSNTLLSITCIAVLVVVVGRCLTVDRLQLIKAREVTIRATRILKYGDLTGADSSGHLHKPSGRVVVLFAIHANHELADVAFWNEVAHLTSQAPPKAVEYIAVCDAGARCRDLKTTTTFSVLAFMSPLQMETIARADGQHEALLYLNNTLATRVSVLAGPRTVAATITKTAGN